MSWILTLLNWILIVFNDPSVMILLVGMNQCSIPIDFFCFWALNSVLYSQSEISIVYKFFSLLFFSFLSYIYMFSFLSFWIFFFFLPLIFFPWGYSSFGMCFFFSLSFIFFLPFRRRLTIHFCYSFLVTFFSFIFFLFVSTKT